MSRIKQTFWNVLSVALLAAAIVVGVSVQAATVTSANDYPSTLQTATAADHTVVFTTSSGIAEGETLTIEFSSAFDTSALIEDDVDIADDGIDLTTATNCSGTEQASVVIAADVLTITICSGDGGSIAAASEVTVEIGANATSSGSGANRTTNPAAPGTYFVSIAGTFGDRGSIALPIVSKSSVPVTALVNQGTGGGGGTPEGCGDSVAPTISNVIVSSITGTSALISWNTDESSDSKVDYGVTSSYEIGTETNTSLTTSHAVSLTGLSQGVTYHFRVRSADLCGNEKIGSDQTFTTADTTACVISSLSVVDITTSSARVTWTTNESATAQVEYGLTTSYGTVEVDETFQTTHSIGLSGLTAGTTYHYEASCEDASGNIGVSGDETFSTVIDAPPGNVSGLTATPEETSCFLEWTNPTDTDLAGIRVVGCTDTYPSNESDLTICSIIYDGLASQATESGLSSATTYYYGVFPYDESGQFASGALVSCTTSAPVVEPEPEPEPVPEPEPTPEPSPEPEAPSSGGVVCGDLICSTTESTDSCPSDCPAEGPVCGDAVCEEDEDSSSCPSDCPVAQLPPTTAEPVDADQVEFFVANLAVELIPTSDGKVSILGGRPVRIQLLADQIENDVDRVQLVLGAESYLMSPNFSQSGDMTAASVGDRAYIADITSPSVSASYALAVSIYYTDGTTQTIPLVGLVLPDGYVFERTDAGAIRVPSAKATLFEDTGESVVWDGSPFGQFNPVTTDPDGAFAWYVQNGLYDVRTEKVGYETRTLGTFAVENNIVNPVIQMTALPVLPPEEEVVPTPEVPPSPAVEAVQEAVQETVSDVVNLVTDSVQAIRELPGAQEAAVFSTPALAVTAVATTTVLATSFGLLPFLQYLFTAPVLFFWRRKRKGFGVVYNAISKTPVDLAIVRIFQLNADGTGIGRLIRSRVTDKGGRYFFLVQPGVYRLAVTKPGYTFPTGYLAEKKEDGVFLDVYHGEPITVTDKDAVITANIPMDPSQGAEAQTPAKVKREQLMRRLQQVVAISGILVSGGFALIRPTSFTIAMVGVQIVIYLLVRRLAAPSKPKSWGIVYDKLTGRPLSNVVVRVFEPLYNKLLDTRVTDSKGRYTFLLGPNEYYSVYEKPGFESEVVRPIDLTKNQEPVDLTVNVSLHPEGTKPKEEEAIAEGEQKTP